MCVDQELLQQLQEIMVFQKGEQEVLGGRRG